MTAPGRALVLALAALVVGLPAHAQRASVDASQVTALIGLARTARDQGRYKESLSYFLDAERRQPFAAALLVELFWVAHRVDADTARGAGDRILKVSPGESSVRDALIGLLAGARDETAVRALAEGGARQDPSSALWPRRLAESHLREGQGGRAAEFYQRAATFDGGTPDDRAQRALALELAKDPAAAMRAWDEVGPGVWSRRPEWTASRDRVIASLKPPRPIVRRTAPVPAPTPVEVIEASRRALSNDPCATEPLASLAALAAAEAFIAAVQARRPDCPAHAEWVSSAAERAIGAGRFAEALALVEAPAARLAAPVSLREQHGVLLHWTGQHARAAMALRLVVAEAPDRIRAADALIDALRATGEADAAWDIAHTRWGTASAPAARKVALAELALETGRVDEALTRARALEPSVSADATLSQKTQAVSAGALLARGRAAEIRTLAGPVDPALGPGLTLATLDAVASTEGIFAALMAAQSVASRASFEWADVMARRAVWHTQLGQRSAAAALLATIDAVDATGGELTRAEVALAAGRPADSARLLRPLVAAQHRRTTRAREVLASALAEQGEWDEALSLLGDLRRTRPHEVRWTVRDAEWRHRQSPSPATLRELEAVVATVPDLGEARSALARAYLRTDRPASALGALPPSLPSAPDHDLIVAVKALRAAARPAEAIAVARQRAHAPVEMLLLRAEIVAAHLGPAAADAEFEALTTQAEADPAWYLLWMDVHRDSAAQQRVLTSALARLPSSALLQERQAAAAWARRDEPAALKAADAALAIDKSRIGPWFVKIDIAGTNGRAAEVAALARNFEREFSGSPSVLMGMGEMLAGLARSPDDPAIRQALEWTERVLAAEPGNTAARITRARLLATAGDVPGAMAVVDGLIASQPDMPQVRKLRAELLASTGRYEEAVAAYDRYFVLVPDDLAARRQQARIDGWRGATGASLDRYERLVKDASHVPAVVAEAAAKRAYYAARWHEAARRYDAWLALEPDELEARLERAQVHDHLGDVVRAIEALRPAARMTTNQTAVEALARLERRGRPSLNVFSVGTSAEGPARQQLLDLLDTGAGLSDGFGAGHGLRVRVFGGPSFAQASDRDWSGYHVGAGLTAAPSPSIGLQAEATYRALRGLDAHWFGDARATWHASSSLTLGAGVLRALVSENELTLETRLAGVGPVGRVRWQPTADFTAEVTGSRLTMTDDNTRLNVRASLTQRLLKRANEVRLVAASELFAYQDASDQYFSPSGFWRHDVGLEWRGWLTTPRFFGDKERWLSATYLFGVDNRQERYHTMRAGADYELASGVSAMAEALVVRSRVYDGARVMLGVRLKHVPSLVR